MCQFLLHQVWHEQTENAIEGLTKTSSKVAESLKNSSRLQEDIVKNQQETLDYQVNFEFQHNFEFLDFIFFRKELLNMGQF